MKRPFSDRTYEARVAETKRRMEQRGLSVLLVTDPANMNYLTGYDAWSFYVHQMAVVTLQDPAPLWIGRPMDASGARAMTWLPHDNVFDYPDSFVQSRDHHPMDRVADILRARGHGATTVGVESDVHYFTARCMFHLEQGLPDASLIDATHLLHEQRLLKSAEELTYIRQAAVITDRAVQAGIDAIEVGTRQNDMAARVWHALIAGTPEFGGDYPATMPMFPTGRDFSVSYHTNWSDRPFMAGTSTGFELAGVRYHYHAPLARTVVLGTPPARMREAVLAIQEGMAAAFAVMRPGVTAEEVDAEWRAVAGRRGFDKGARIGYTVGLAFPPTWGDGATSLRKGDRTVLQENMVFHFIPSFMIDDWGIEISETVVVTDNGGEALSTLPRDIVIKP